MDQQNIDRLFREKLGHMEVTPSSKAWSQVEKQIRPKKTPIVYWVAASVTILLVSWMVWPEPVQQNFSPILSEIDHPVNQELPDFKLPTIERVVAEKDEEQAPKQAVPVQKTLPKQRPQAQFAANEIPEEKSELVNDATQIEEVTEAQTAVAEAETVEKPSIIEEVQEEAQKPTFGAVKITYIASAGKKEKENVQKNDSTGVLKKFIAFTEKIDPGDMLADIKTAKDNLFNGGLKNKKERSSL